MNKNIFNRPNRMVHKFGELENQNDPLGNRTFDPKFPVRPDQLRSGPIERSTYGEHDWHSPRSAVSKPNGKLANMGGPSTDIADSIARPIPASTKKRKQP